MMTHRKMLMNHEEKPLFLRVLRVLRGNKWGKGYPRERLPSRFGPFFRSRTSLRGFSLLEVLIALLILSIGLLGLAALQMRGLKYNHDAYVRSQSTILAYDIMDRMRGNSANSADYADPVSTSIVCSDTVGSGANERRCWEDKLVSMLPAGSGSIAQNGTDTSLYNVTINWTDRETGNSVNQTWMVQP